MDFVHYFAHFFVFEFNTLVEELVVDLSPVVSEDFNLGTPSVEFVFDTFLNLVHGIVKFTYIRKQHHIS